MGAYAHPVASVQANVYADVHNTCLTYTPAHAWYSQHLSKWMHTLRKKCICTRACAHMQQCRRVFAMEATANLSWVLREHRACRLPLALAARPAVSTKPVARRCSPKKSFKIHASSWRGRRCGVVQASFDHPRWCRPRPVCLWVALALGRRPHPQQSRKSPKMKVPFQRGRGHIGIFLRMRATQSDHAPLNP